MPTEPVITTASLYEEHWQLVFQLLPTYGIFGSDQEDVAQIVWMNVHTRLHTYDPARQSPRAWLTGFVRRCAGNFWRRRHRHPERPGAQVGHDVPTCDLDPEEHALLRTIEHAIRDDEEREAFLLQVRHGLTVEEIAEAVGATIGCIQWRLHQARERLQTAEAGQ